MNVRRRNFLSAAAMSLGLGSAPAAWTRALLPQAAVGPSPYGPLGAPDVNGVALPAGFSATVIAVSHEVVGASGFRWHGAPDGGACFPAPDGGWVYTSNAELAQGGASAVRFAPDGSIVDAYSILAGTRINCAGGPTPWNTWLSCEEFGRGRVWECDPFKAGQGIARPGLGRFSHEAAAVDPTRGCVYMTEDEGDGRFYRFRPTVMGDLSSGVLEAARLEPIRANAWDVYWKRVSPLRPARDPETSAFARGEGAWYHDGSIYFCTTADDRVWRYEPSYTDAPGRMTLIYDAAAIGAAAPLREPDNVTVHAPSGDVFVAEDADDLQLVLLADVSGQLIAAPFLQLVGHDGSEVTGPAFSPDGSRLYFSSQRGTGGRSLSPGITFEVRGPFRGA